MCLWGGYSGGPARALPMLGKLFTELHAQPQWASVTSVICFWWAYGTLLRTDCTKRPLCSDRSTWHWHCANWINFNSLPCITPHRSQWSWKSILSSTFEDSPQSSEDVFGVWSLCQNWIPYQRTGLVVWHCFPRLATRIQVDKAGSSYRAQIQKV